MDLEDLAAAVLVGRRDRDAAVEAARAQQRLVEDLGAVGRAEHDHGDVGLEAVHLGEDLVERLLALVVAAAEADAAAMRERPMASSSSMKMIAGEDSLACLEEVAHARGADADDRLDELGAPRSRRTARPPPPRRRARAASCRCRAAREQHAARDPAAEPAVAVGVLEEVDDLGELRLGLVDAGDVGERDALLAALDAARPRAPERARARPSGPPPARRARKTNRPTSRITGPKPSSRLIEQRRGRVDRLGLDDVTSLSCSSLESSSVLANVGISVSKFFAAFGVLPSGGYVISFLNSPSTVSPLAEIRSTLPSSTCSRNVGLYGDVDRGLLARARAARR